MSENVVDLHKPESSQAGLRRYLAIDPAQRLDVVEGNLAIMVQAMLKEDPGDVGIKLNLPAVMADVIREIRLIKQQIGMVSPKDSKPPEVEAVQPSGVIRVEQIPLDEVPT